MLVLGLDPGLAITGYGLVRESPSGKLELLAYGAVTWGGLLEVLEPKELRALVRDIADEVRTVHSED